MNDDINTPQQPDEFPDRPEFPPEPSEPFDFDAPEYGGFDAIDALEHVPTVFPYEAQVVILGWVFSKLPNGEFWVRTSDFIPAISPDGRGTTCAEMHLSADLAALVAALLAVGTGPKQVTGFPEGTPGIGYSA